MLETAERLNNQAIALAAKGDYHDAIACFMRAITIETENYLLWFNLGATYRDSGDLKNAKSALKKAHTINPEDDDTTETLALVYYAQGRFEEALSICAEGLTYNPENPHLWNTTGVVFFNQEDYEQAQDAFEHAVSINPYYYDALFNLHDVYCELGNKHGAEECAIRMKELDKNQK